MSTDRLFLQSRTDRSLLLQRRYLGFTAPITEFSSVAFGTIGRGFLAPIDVPMKVEIDALVYQIGNAATGNVRLALYEEGATIDLPDGGTLIAESGNLSQDNPADVDRYTISPVEILEPGRYYGAIMGDDINGTFYRAFPSTTGDITPGRYFDNSVGFGVFDDPCPVTLAIARAPALYLRVLRSI